MRYGENLRHCLMIAALAATAAFPLSAASAADIDLGSVVQQSLKRPQAFARGKAGGLLKIEDADTRRFTPSLLGDVHHAEGAGIPMNRTVGLDATTVTLELSQPLYRSGQSRAQAQAEDSRLRAEQADKQLERQAAALLIINTYLDAQRDEEQAALMRQMKTSPQTLHAKETSLAFLREELTELGGIAPDAALADVPPPPGLPANLQSALRAADDKHPAMARALYLCAAAEAASRAVNWAGEPNIDLRGAIDRTSDSYSDAAEQESGMIGLRATIPFAGDGERSARRVNARESAEDTRQNIDSTRQTLRQNVIAAWDALSAAREDIDFQRQKARLAEAATTGALPKESRLAGRHDQTAAFEKLAQQAKIAEISARYAARKAEFALLAATGQLLDNLGGLRMAQNLSSNTEITDAQARLSALSGEDTGSP
jgi:outer membrane protein TolC